MPDVEEEGHCHGNSDKAEEHHQTSKNGKLSNSRDLGGCARSGMEGGRVAPGVVWRGGGVRQEWYGGGEGCARSGMEGGYREEERGKREYELWRCTPSEVTSIHSTVHVQVYMFLYGIGLLSHNLVLGSPREIY